MGPATMAEVTRTENQRSGVVAILVGALFCGAIQVLMSLIGGAVGLSAFSWERGEMPSAGIAWAAGAFALIGVGVAFFLGGYLASGMAAVTSRRQAAFHGLGVWALVITASLLFLANSTSGIGGMLSQAGFGAGATATGHFAFEPLMEQMERVRIITDGSLLKAKAVTSFVVSEQDLPSPVEQALNKAEKDLRKSTKDKETGKEIRQAAGKVREISAAASGLGALGLLIGLIGAWLGSVFEVRRRTH